MCVRVIIKSFTPAQYSNSMVYSIVLQSFQILKTIQVRSEMMLITSITPEAQEVFLIPSP